MRLKLDENLLARLVGELSALGHDVDTVPEQGLQGSPDPRVWSGARESGRFLITQDLDFSDLRVFKPGTHHGILLVRLREPSRRYLIERIRDIFKNEAVERWIGAFVVCTESKVRVRWPASRGS